MKPRIVILIVTVAGLAIYLATRATAPPVEDIEFEDTITGEELRKIRLIQTLLAKRPLPGSEPAEASDLAIQVEVDESIEKNRLYFYITEAHGYYVETFEIYFYFNPDPDNPREDDARACSAYIDDYVKANETLKGCIEVVPAEIQTIGGDMGTSENWEAEIVSHGRARMQNPDPLPPLTETGKCR